MMKKIFLILIIILTATVIYWFRVPINELFQELIQPSLPSPITYIQVQENRNGEPVNSNTAMNKNTTDLKSDIENKTVSLPDEINLAVPFTSQAPQANWDLPYQEACEEAASLMVHYYWQEKTFSSKEEADKEILELVDFENNTSGAYEHTTAEQTVQLIKDKWGYTQVDLFLGNEVTLDRIKQELANGYPVIVLAAGRELGNPNYKQPGPLYHALVIKGYLSDGQIITNDPGTRKGADYLYNPQILLDAIHDWNDGDVPRGEKNMIVIRANL